MTNKMYLIAKQIKLIDWGMVFLGAKGLPSGKLSASDVSDFACQKLANSDEVRGELLTAISEVAFCTDITEEIIDYLYSICQQKRIDVNVSYRKWRFLSLNNLMTELPDDCVYGLLKLNEFWMVWGESVGCPNIAQGVGNDISPAEYYTDEQFSLTVKRHQEWLKKEGEKLIKMHNNIL